MNLTVVQWKLIRVLPRHRLGAFHSNGRGEVEEVEGREEGFTKQNQVSLLSSPSPRAPTPPRPPTCRCRRRDVRWEEKGEGMLECRHCHALKSSSTWSLQASKG